MVMPASSAPDVRPQCSITRTSLTATQMISSTPLARKPSAVRMKLGRCAAEQVDVYRRPAAKKDDAASSAAIGQIDLGHLVPDLVQKHRARNSCPLS